MSFRQHSVIFIRLALAQGGGGGPGLTHHGLGVAPAYLLDLWLLLLVVRPLPRLQDCVWPVRQDKPEAVEADEKAQEVSGWTSQVFRNLTSFTQ